MNMPKWEPVVPFEEKAKAIVELILSHVDGPLKSRNAKTTLIDMVYDELVEAHFRGMCDESQGNV